ncbi:condensation domain-containing protein, partial [Streptomyces sp. NPDC057638]|uniref:condensation domain-containing protein n=1 Tax=Streptomyces sp. NPDC057638 TaxID=3346190 RepID=UPI0036C1D76A
MQSRFSDILPLAPLQEGLLFHALYDEEGPDVYIVQVALELDGPLDPDRLRTAAETLLTRHPHLTACFLTRTNGQPIQVIPTHTTLPWHDTTLNDLQDLPHTLAEARTQRFDMTTPPLLRYTLIHHPHTKTQNQNHTDGIHTTHRHTLALTIHHILLDGWSMPILIRELLT